MSILDDVEILENRLYRATPIDINLSNHWGL